MDSDFINEPTEEQLWESLLDQVGVAKVNALIDLTIKTYEKGEYGYALSIADSGVELAATEEDVLTLARAISVRADVYSLMDDHHKAAKDYLESAQRYEEFGSSRAASRDYYDGAHELLCLGDFTEAASRIEKAYVLATEAGDYEGMGRCLMKQAQIQANLDASAEEILVILDQARDHLRGNTVQTYIFEVDERRALALASMERYDEAFEIIRDALYVAEWADYGRSAYYNYLLGKLLNSSNRPAEGLPFIEKSEQLNIASADAESLGAVYLERSKIMEALGRREEALEDIARSRSHYERCGRDEKVQECDQERTRFLQEASS